MRQVLLLQCLVAIVSASSTIALSFAGAQTPEMAKALPVGTRPRTTAEKYSQEYRQFILNRTAAGLNAKRQEVLTTWRGTAITPSAQATGKLLRQHEIIARQFSLQDPQPDARRLHFGWCDGKGLVCRGWTGTIVGLKPSVGGILVQVKVQPYIISGIVRMSDYFLETYEYSDTGFQFLDGTGPQPDRDGGLLFL
jgi:hypothetical protein